MESANLNTTAEVVHDRVRRDFARELGVHAKAVREGFEVRACRTVADNEHRLVEVRDRS